MITNKRIPKVLLKSVYDRFRTEESGSITAEIQNAGISMEDGLALAKLAKACDSFSDFETIISADLNPGSVQLSPSQMSLMAGGVANAAAGISKRAAATYGSAAAVNAHNLKVDAKLLEIEKARKSVMPKDK